MPSRTPTEFGEIYHLINRGVDKRRIFLKTQDYLRFVLALYFFNDHEGSDIWNKLKYEKEEIAAVLGRPDRPSPQNEDGRRRMVDLLAFALMPNHYHLIVREITEGGISAFMQKLGGYTWYFNKQYDRVGALFQGRYKSVAVKDENQLQNVFTYVHTNPVELVEPKWKDFKVGNASTAIRFLENYKWTSYNDYIGRPKFPTVTQRDFFTEFYGGEAGCKQAVEDWISFKAKNAQLDIKNFE